jgi:D-amino peptidase
MRTLLSAVSLLAVIAGAARPAGAQRPLKVYISADMEGVAGAVTGDQLAPTGFEYERFRGFMTAEVLAAIQGARDAGATTIVVSDSHGNGENLLIERLPDDVMIVRSWPRPLMMMQGIDSTFAAALFIGYHASTTSPVGVRAHTMSSADYTALALNGVNMPEAGINAAIAGYFGVPVVMISGDDAAVAETRGLIGNIEGAVVKRAISFHSAISMTPQAAQTLIREAARRGVSRRAELRPYVVTAPVRLDLTFKNYLQAELASYLPDMERPTAHSVRYTGRDILVVSRLIEFFGQYSPGLRP